MPNTFVDHRDAWLRMSDIDYLGQFVKSWLAFNAWYRSAYSETQDRKIINEMKWQANPVLSKLRPMLAEGKQFIRNAFDAMIASHRQEWHIKQFLQFHARIVAVMFHLAVPWDVNRERLVYTTMVNYIQAGTDVAGWRLLEKELGGLYR